LENAPAAVEAAPERGARPARADKKLERYPTWSETAPGTAFRRDDRGIAAVELALILPVLVFGLLGVLEFSQFYSVQSRVTWISQALGDVISQSTSQNQTDLSKLGDAVSSIMYPYSTTGMTVVAASLVRNTKDTTATEDDVAEVESTWGTQKALLGSVADAPALDATAALELIPAGYSVVYVAAKYTYQSYTGLPFLQGKVLTSRAYVRPRSVSVITFH